MLLPMVYGPAMPRTALWHYSEALYHHANSECVYAALGSNGERSPGGGGKPLCPLCERLNRAEEDLERNG